MSLTRDSSLTLKRICLFVAVISGVLLPLAGGWTRVRAMSPEATAMVMRSKGTNASASVSGYSGMPQGGCTYTLSSTSRTMPRDGTLPFTPDSNPQNIPAAVMVNTNPGCAWTATSNASFLAIAPGTGSSGRAEA